MTPARTLLITGGTGFLGSRIVRLFLVAGWSVVVLKRQASSLTRLVDVLDNPQLLFLDTESFDAESFFSSTIIDVVIHTATNYGRNNESVEEVQQTNFVYPNILAEACKYHQVPLFINTDTFFVEGMGKTEAEREYVYSKKAFLRAAQKMFNPSDTKFVNMCVYQMYGPGDSEKKFIPFIISSLYRGVVSLPLTVGLQTRDFIYVDDVAYAYGAVLAQSASFIGGETVHVGTGRVHTIRDVVELIYTKMHAQTELLWGGLPYQEHDMMSSCAPINKNPSFLQWAPATTLSEGLDKTIVYFEHTFSSM